MEAKVSRERIAEFVYKSIDEIRHIRLREDTVTSIAVGLVLGLVIIIFLNIFPGEPFDYNTGTIPSDPRKKKKMEDPVESPENESSGVSTSTSGSTGMRDSLRHRKRDAPCKETERSNEVVDPDIDLCEDTCVGKPPEEEDPFSDTIIEKSRKLAEKFGLDDEQFNQAVINAKRQYRNGESASHGEIRTIMNLIIPVSLIVGGIYFMNRDYGGAGTYWLIRLFPKEAAILGFYNT